MEDAKALKASAQDFLHPEAPVPASTGGLAKARCYFDRPSAPEAEGVEDDLERDYLLEDAAGLKAAASRYLHPEKPVAASAGASARCYFGRPSAPETEDVEDDLERDYLSEDVKALKAGAALYLHPELAVKVAPEATGRGYFGRLSAPDAVDVEDDWERDLALRDTISLKASAARCLHPEAPVPPTKAAVTRSAPGSWRAPVDAEHRAAALADSMLLKAGAAQYLHPELPVKVDAEAKARCYFEPAHVDAEEDLELDRLLEDVRALKAGAARYLHPELPVRVDPAAAARCYFGRASAPEYEDAEQVSERAKLAGDARALKAAAAQYLHPELPVEADAEAAARGYFGRASAPEYEDVEDDLELDCLVQDLCALKAAAAQYLHPELPVKVDAGAMARCYFARPSAPDYGDAEGELERDSLLDDIRALKAAAAQYLHPELPVKVDAGARARCYFERLSAPEYEDAEDDLERDDFVEDMKALKATAAQYLHPELAVPLSAVAVTRGLVQDAGGEGDALDLEERAAVLEEVHKLKAAAAQYLHPEVPVKVDPGAAARCYFDRPSAPERESQEDVAEREAALEDALRLKSLAARYLAPHAPVSVDPEVAGRSYFERASAPREESEDGGAEDAALERELVLAEAKALKDVAAYYLHPEVAVSALSVPGGRGYFDRPSARHHDAMIHTFPAHDDDLHHDEHHDEHIDHFGLDEEIEARLYEDLRQHLPSKPLKAKASRSGLAAGSDGSDEEEGKLSRSPSSIMLFTEESVYD
jgi:hypothetical protein